MAVGDWHSLDGGRYVFRETLHGPFVATSCVDCGGECYVVQQTGRIGAGGLPEDTGSTVRPRCSACGRARWGAPVKLYADRPRVQHGIGFPSRVITSADLRGQAVKAGKTTEVRRGFVGLWPDDVPMPAAAVGFVELLRRCVRGGAQVRVVRTIALGPTGALVETCGVHWRGGVAFWTKHETPRVRHEVPRKVDLTRTATGRRRVLRFDPKVWWTGGVTWVGEVYSPLRLTVTQATKLIMERYETGV